MSELYPRQFLKSLGPLFQEQRKKSGFSVRDVARSANIAHTIVFDIENKKITPNPETLTDLFGTLGVPLYKDGVTLWPLRDTLNAFFEVFYMDKHHEMTLYYQSLLKGEEILLHSPLRIEFMFAKAIYNLLIEKKDVAPYLKEVEKLADCFTDRQNQALELVKGMNGFINESYDSALNHFINAEKHTASKNMHNLAFYYLAFTTDKLFKKELSLYYARIASDKYSDANNFKRKLDLDLLLAKNMIEVGNLQVAEDYLNSIRYAISNPDADEAKKEWFINIRSYLSYVKNNYEEASEHLKETDDDNVGANLLKAFVAYRRDHMEEAKGHLKSIMRLKEDENKLYAHCTLIFLDHLGDKPKPEELDHAIHYVLEHLLDFETKRAQTFFTNLIIEHYEAAADYKNALSVAKILNRHRN